MVRFGFGLALMVVARPVGAQELLPGLQEIVDSGKLRIAIIDADLPPMILRTAKGELRGFDIALATDIARKLNVEVDFVSAGPTQTDVIDAVAKKQADLGLSYLSMGVKAGMRVYFTRPYMIEADMILINRAKGIAFNRECPSRSDVRRLLTTPGTIGLVERSVYDTGAQSIDPNAAPKKFKDIANMMQAVFEGTVTATVQGEVAAKFYLSRTPEAAIRLKLCELPVAKNRIGIAVRPDGEDLLRWLNLYIEARGIIVETDSLIYREDETLR